MPIMIISCGALTTPPTNTIYSNSISTLGNNHFEGRYGFGAYLSETNNKFMDVAISIPINSINDVQLCAISNDLMLYKSNDESDMWVTGRGLQINIHHGLKNNNEVAFKYGIGVENSTAGYYASPNIGLMIGRENEYISTSMSIDSYLSYPWQTKNVDHINGNLLDFTTVHSVSIERLSTTVGLQVFPAIDVYFTKYISIHGGIIFGVARSKYGVSKSIGLESSLSGTI